MKVNLMFNMKSTKLQYVSLSLVLFTFLAFASPGTAQKDASTGLLCGNVEKAKTDVPKSKYSRVDSLWQFDFEEGCCTLAGTSNAENKKLEKNLTTFIGDAERTYGQEDGICENLSDDNPLNLACIASTGTPLALRVTASFDTHTECCCSSCRCFGDPICQSFHKDTSYTDSQYEDFDTWILCDGRSSNNCLVTKEACEKEKDYNGNTCAFEEDAPIYGVKSASIATQRELDQAIKDGDDLKKNRCKLGPHKLWSKTPPEACKVKRWDSFKYGSPCKPPKGSSNPLTMYAIEDKFDFTVYQRDRGYIDKIEITTACNDITYSLTVEDCLNGKGWTKEGKGEDVIKFHKHPYTSLAGGRWSFLDYSSGVTGDVTCYANGVEYDKKGNVIESYVPRFNVEHLNDPLWRWNENKNGEYVHPLDGYCVNREFDTGRATNPYKQKLDEKCGEPSTRGNLHFVRLTQFREICRDSILPPEINECNKDFCYELIDGTPHLSKSEKKSRKKDCKTLMNAVDDVMGSNIERYAVRPKGWPRSYQQGFCHTIMCSRDERYCIDYTDCYESMIPGQAPTPRPTKNEEICREIYEKCEEPFLRPFETLDDAKEPVRQAIREFNLNELPLWNRKANDFIGDVTVIESSYPDNELDCEAELPICEESAEPNLGKKSLNPDERGAVLQYYNKKSKKWVDFQAFPEYDKSKDCYVKTYNTVDFGKDKYPELFNNRIRMIQRERKYEQLEVTRCGVTHIPKMTFRLREIFVKQTPICPLCIHQDGEKSKQFFDEKIQDNALCASASSCCHLCNPELAGPLYQIPDPEDPTEQYASRWFDTDIEKICKANGDFRGDCKKDSKSSGAELEIELNFNKEFNDCCLNCHAFGDPVIVDFVGNKEKWAVCHARNEADLEECPDFEEERCTDTKNCEWKPQTEDWSGKNIGIYGSPCRPKKEDMVPLYYKDRNSEIIMVNASQGNRGIIKSTFVSYLASDAKEPKEYIITDKCDIEGGKDGYKKVKVKGGDYKFVFNKWVDVEVTVVCFPKEKQRGLSILINDEDELYDTLAEFKMIQERDNFKASGVCPDLDDYEFGEKHKTGTLLNLKGPCEKRPNLDRLESYRAMCDKYGISVTADWQIEECLDTFCNEDNPHFVHRGDTSTKKCKSDLKYSSSNWSEENKEKFIEKLCRYITLNDVQQDECYDKIVENLVHEATYFAIRGEFKKWTKRNHGLGRKIESSKACRFYFDGRLEDLRDPDLVPNLPNYCCEGFDRTLRNEFNTNSNYCSHCFVPGVYLQYCDYKISEAECVDEEDIYIPWNSRTALQPWVTFEYIPYDTCFQKEQIIDGGKVRFDGNGKVIFKYTIEEDDYKSIFDRPIRVFQSDVNPLKELPFPKGLSPVKGEGNECNTNTGVDVKFRFGLSK